MDDKAIFIGKDTFFKGTITAKTVTVAGYIEGDIIASDRVFIKRGGVVSGSIRTQKLFCEDGGQHNGLIQLEESLPKKTAIELSVSQPNQSQDQPVDQPQKEQKSSAPKATEKENVKQL